MAQRSFDYSRRHYYRLALLLLVTTPFIPELLVLATDAVARLAGCVPNQKEACRFGPVQPSDVIDWVLQVKAGFVVAHAGNAYWLIGLYAALGAWIVACYAVLMLGWTRMRSRLLLGFVVAAIFAILPYFGPMLSLANLVNENCKPNEGGVGTCLIFGGQVGSGDYSPAHDTVIMGWLVLIGGPLAFGIFAGYAVAVIFARVRTARRPVDA